MGAVLFIKVVTSLTAGGGVHDEWCVWASWSMVHQHSHINFQELLDSCPCVAFFCFLCPGMDGQYHYDGLYQVPGGFTLQLVAHGSTQNDPLELHCFSPRALHAQGIMIVGEQQCTESGSFT